MNEPGAVTQEPAPRLWPRGLELIVVGLLAIVLIVPMLLIAAAVKLTSPGPIVYWSTRIGVNNSHFRLPKFRTMRVDTPVVATHQLAEADRFLTPIGSFLRKSSLDELLQLYSIAKGDMTFVGPRPALFNQDDLVALRTERGIERLIPGLTGWAQVNGRDDLSIPQKVELEAYYQRHRSRQLDLRILLMTVGHVLRGTGVKH